MITIYNILRINTYKNNNIIIILLFTIKCPKYLLLLVVQLNIGINV